MKLDVVEFLKKFVLREQKKQGKCVYCGGTSKCYPDCLYQDALKIFGKYSIAIPEKPKKKVDKDEKKVDKDEN